MWFTLHWPPVSHREKLASLVLMGCRAKKEGACICFSVCQGGMHGRYYDGPLSNCILTLPLEERQAYSIQWNHLFLICLQCLEICACEGVHVCVHLFSPGIPAVSPALL